MPRPELALLERYVPLMIAEYERIGMAEEMERYFTGSGDVPITKANCEKSLAELRAIPSGIGFDAYCARVGMNADEIRSFHERVRRSIPSRDESR